MTFSTDKPTVPGIYLWRWHESDALELEWVTQGDDGTLWRNGGRTPAKTGLWCRLVPAEEVEKAFWEGSNGVLGSLHEPVSSVVNQSWTQSRAKRVVEGKE